MDNMANPRSWQAAENFRKRVVEYGGVILEPMYLGANVPHSCRCPVGHACSPRPANLQSGQRLCRQCADRDNPENARRRTVAWENFRANVASLGGEILEPAYLGSYVPHLCRCTCGHECRPMPASLRAGQGMCQVCAGRDSATARNSFYKLVAELGGTVLEQRWLGSHTPHRCLCVNGHECRPSLTVARRHRSLCKICRGLDSATAWENFRQGVSRLGGEVLEPTWLGKDKPHRCRCARGHECRPLPSGIRTGQGMCAICSWRGQDALYVVRNPRSQAVKFGITHGDGLSRLSDHSRTGFTEQILLKTGLAEFLAAHIEQKIKLALMMADVKPVRGREYFSDVHTALILNEIGNWV